MHVRPSHRWKLNPNPHSGRFPAVSGEEVFMHVFLSFHGTSKSSFPSQSLWEASKCFLTPGWLGIFITGHNLGHFNDTVQSTSTVDFENLLQMCESPAPPPPPHPATRPPSGMRQENLLSNKAEWLWSVKRVRRFIIPAKRTRSHIWARRLVSEGRCTALYT